MTEPLASHPNAAVRGLAAGTWSVREFRDYLRTVGTPLIDAAADGAIHGGAEAVPRPDGDVRRHPAAGMRRGLDGDAPGVQQVAVTFVHDLEAASGIGENGIPGLPANPAAAAVGGETRMRTLIDRALPERGAFTDVPGTPIRVQTLDLPADLRFTYLLAQTLPDGTRQRVADVFNPRSGDPSLGGSVAVLPQAARMSRAASVDSTAADSRMAELSFASACLGNERSVWVSVPDGWTATGGPYPFVVVFDGYAAHRAPALRDRLVATGEIRPCVVILVDEAGLRDAELTGNPDLTRALTEELLPRLRSEFALSAEPGDAALSGKSFGGLCAGWTALHAPETFGHAIMQSPSAWYHPDLQGRGTGGPKCRSGHGPRGGPAPDGGTAPDGDPARGGGPLSGRDSAAPQDVDPIPLLIDAFSRARPVPVRLYQECGTLEFGPPPAQIWQHDANRWLHRVLEAQGYDTVYHEFRGGHDAAWWDETWARALRWVFPARSGTSTVTVRRTGGPPAWAP